MSTSQLARELLQRVLASLGDDDLRLVCADALLEAGDHQDAALPNHAY